MGNDDIKQKIWNVDNHENILDYQVLSLSCWLLIRHEVYNTLLFQDVKSGGGVKRTLYIKLKDRFTGFINSVRYWMLLIKSNPVYKKEHFDVVAFNGYTFKTPSGHISKITGFLSETKLKTLNVYKILDLDKVNDLVGSFSFLDFFKPSGSPTQHTAEGTGQINDFTVLLKQLLPELSDSKVAYFKDKLIRISNSGYAFKENITRFLSGVNPKLVILEDANLGYFHEATIIQVCKENNIKIGEAQHGIFDVAYQYGKNLLPKPAFKKQKTDYIFTFGTYFNNQIVNASTNVSIGYYYLNKKLPTTQSKSAEGVRNILFVTQGIHTHKIIPLLHEALANLPFKFQLIVKLHPMETQVDSAYDVLSVYNPVYKFADDIYVLLAEADQIIGSYSTVLIECIAFKKVPLIFQDSFSDTFIPKEIGARFSNSQELRNIITNPGDINNVDSNFYWQSNTAETFNNFYRTQIAGDGV